MDFTLATHLTEDGSYTIKAVLYGEPMLIYVHPTLQGLSHAESIELLRILQDPLTLTSDEIESTWVFSHVL